MRQYFRISRYFLFLFIGLFFAVALIALAAPAGSTLRYVAIRIGAVTILISPVIAVATLITGVSAMKQTVEDHGRYRRKTNEFITDGLVPDKNRVKQILEKLDPEERAYIEYYYFMLRQQDAASNRIQNDVQDNAQSNRREAVS